MPLVQYLGVNAETISLSKNSQFRIDTGRLEDLAYDSYPRIEPQTRKRTVMQSGNEKMNNVDVMQKHGEDAWQYFQDENFQKAIESYDLAIALARKIEETSHLAVFLTYKALAAFECEGKNEALQSVLEAIELAKSFENKAIEVNATLVLAEIYRDSGNSPRAIDTFLNAYDLAVFVGDPESQELSLTNLGRLYLDRGWAEQASQCYRQALESLEDLSNKAAILGSLGLCMAELGVFEDAINYFRTANLEAELQEDPFSMAVCIGSEGNVLFELSQFERALNCYQNALSLCRKIEDKNGIGAWLGNIGTTLDKLNKAEEALEALNEALTIAIENDDKHSQAAHLDSLGDCLYGLGKFDQAKSKYEEALQLSQTLEDRFGQRIYLTNLGKVYQRLGQLQPAFDYFGQAVEIFDEQRATICADDLKTSFANRGEDLYKDAVSLCMSMGKRVDALELIGRAKSRALLDLLSNSPIDISTLADDGDQSLRSLIAKEKDLRSQIDHLERVIWQGSGGQDSTTRGATTSGEETKQIYSEWRKVINQLKGSHPNYASLVSAETLTFNEILSLWNGPDKCLNENIAVVEFYLTDEYIVSTGLWSKAEEPLIEVFSDPAERAMLDMDIETFLEMSQTEGWEVPKNLCKRIYDGLIARVVEKLPDSIEQLIIVPHGNLFHLPFAALYDGQSYLCEKYSLSYIPATTLITVLSKSRQKKIPAKPDKYLVSAISDYSSTRKDGLVLSSTLRSSYGLEDLSYTLEEADSIMKLGESQVSEAKLLTNEEVKEAFPNLFGEYPVVHFAGHAIFNSVEPMASGLVLSDGTILTAASILERRSLKTHCGHLLVLSACQTGVNKVTAGGEVLGLARALIYAGMPNLILTLWEVADRSTSDLMKEFHDSWQSGNITIAEALRKVQVSAIKQGLPLHAWAPFIHFGID